MNEGRWNLTTGCMIMGVAPPSGQQRNSTFASSCMYVTFTRSAKRKQNAPNETHKNLQLLIKRRN